MCYHKIEPTVVNNHLRNDTPYRICIYIYEYTSRIKILNLLSNVSLDVYTYISSFSLKHQQPPIRGYIITSHISFICNIKLINLDVWSRDIFLEGIQLWKSVEQRCYQLQLYWMNSVSRDQLDMHGSPVGLIVTSLYNIFNTLSKTQSQHLMTRGCWSVMVIVVTNHWGQ